jgi:NAD+ kinase
MKKILLVYNPSKLNVKKFLTKLKTVLNKSYLIDVCDSESVTEKKCLSDLIITLGGDGTILRVGQFAVKKGIPVCGVNLGGLGYLAEFGINEIFSGLKLFFYGKILPQERSVLEVWHLNKTYIAINDCVIKSNSSKVCKIEVYINNEFLTDVVGDGVIVATPTGSTAYSLASGGSIVEPASKVILLTPICPHSLTHRPVIFDENKIIELKIPKYKSNTNLVLSLDSQKNFSVKMFDSIKIKVCEKKMLFLPNPKKSFYTILEQKLSWGKR